MMNIPVCPKKTSLWGKGSGDRKLVDKDFFPPCHPVSNWSHPFRFSALGDFPGLGSVLSRHQLGHLLMLCVALWPTIWIPMWFSAKPLPEEQECLIFPHCWQDLTFLLWDLEFCPVLTDLSPSQLAWASSSPSSTQCRMVLQALFSSL